MTFKPDHPLVSVIIPTYNRAALLEQTIESVLAQTYPAIELIVVDDGSTDDTPALLERYGDRIRAIRQQNAGGTAARNTGIAAARGAFLNFLDHDDLMLPDKIARQVDLLRSRPECGLVHCGFYRIDRDGRKIDIVNHLPEGDVRERLVQGCFLWSGAPLIRREVIDEVGLFDESVWSSDAEMWLRIAIAGYEFGCVQEPLGCYRILPDSSMADVARTERMDMATLERTFADPRLPPEARAKRDAAFFNQRFWLACRYYTVGQWDDARRNLRIALELRPELLGENCRELLQLFCASALDPRVDDPAGFVDRLLDQLPPDVQAVMEPFAELLRGWVLLGVALRSYAAGAIGEARNQMAAAVACAPELLEKPDEFERALTDYALRLPVRPHRYVDLVLANLPPQARALRVVRRRALSGVDVIGAFQDYNDGRPAEVAPKVWRALRRRPALLANRGVLAIFFRSLVYRMANP